MKKIALIADVHGNLTALQAVLEDARKESADECWFLGDLLMPGPGTNELFESLEKANTTVFVRGNWEDCLLYGLDNRTDYSDPTDVYNARLSQYADENLAPEYIEKIRELPLHATQKAEKLTIGICHNLPGKNFGRFLMPTNPQENFNQLFDQDYDIVICAHTHHQFFRYSSHDQLIINPGSVGEPHLNWHGLSADLRPQYATLKIDRQGVPEVQFKRISYDIEKEYQLAIDKKLPYLELYKEILYQGKVRTHDTDLLRKVNEKHRYIQQAQQYFEKS